MMALAQPHIGMKVFGVNTVAVRLVLNRENELTELIGMHEFNLPVVKVLGFKDIT